MCFQTIEMLNPDADRRQIALKKKKKSERTDSDCSNKDGIFLINFNVNRQSS